MSAPSPALETAAPRAHPASPLALFIAFTLLALQGFGGVLAVAQRELVDRRGWLTRLEFVELYAVAQLLPGPNVVNLSLMIGDRHFGLRGALAALAGMLTFPLLVVLALAVVYAEFAGHPAVAGALRGMGAVAAGLIAGVGIKMLASVRSHPLGRPLCLALAGLSFAAMAWLRLPLFWILAALGGAACVLTFRKLAP